MMLLLLLLLLLPPADTSRAARLARVVGGGDCIESAGTRERENTRTREAREQRDWTTDFITC